MNTLSSLLNWIGNTIGANPSTLTTTSKTLVGAINEVGTDYIVEQGTSGIWTYRKWNSGIAECWGSVYAQKDCTTAWGNMYDSGTVASQSFPNGLFTSEPTLTLTVTGHSTATLQLETSGAVTAERTCNYYYTMPYSSTGVQATVYFQAIGRWK